MRTGQRQRPSARFRRSVGLVYRLVYLSPGRDGKRKFAESVSDKTLPIILDDQGLVPADAMDDGCFHALGMADVREFWPRAEPVICGIGVTLRQLARR